MRVGRLMAAAPAPAAPPAPAAAPPPLRAPRVVSLLASATDIVAALELTHLLVGRSHEARTARLMCARRRCVVAPPR